MEYGVIINISPKIWCCNLLAIEWKLIPRCSLTMSNMFWHCWNSLCLQHKKLRNARYRANYQPNAELNYIIHWFVNCFLSLVARISPFSIYLWFGSLNCKRDRKIKQKPLWKFIDCIQIESYAENKSIFTKLNVYFDAHLCKHNEPIVNLSKRVSLQKCSWFRFACISMLYKCDALVFFSGTVFMSFCVCVFFVPTFHLSVTMCKIASNKKLKKKKMFTSRVICCAERWVSL